MNPIIIIGMHRSGTSMLANILEELGLFVGKRNKGLSEASFFLKLNGWLLRLSGGSWEWPEPIRDLLGNARMRRLAEDFIRFSMRTPRSINYLGWSGYLRYHTPADLDVPWGWKDPRNTFTLPLWLDIFPEAKVIHISRNGIDVANSLKVRVEKSFPFGKEQQFHYKRILANAAGLYLIRPKKNDYRCTLRCATLDGGLSLWEEYLKEAQSHVEALGQRALEIKYEDFLAEPVVFLKELVNFCNLQASDERISAVVGRLNKGKAFAYKNNPELQKFAFETAERLKAFGY